MQPIALYTDEDLERIRIIQQIIQYGDREGLRDYISTVRAAYKPKELCSTPLDKDLFT